MYTGWKLKQNTIERIKNLYAPVHPDFIGHHITYMFGKDSKQPDDADIKIIGHCVTDKVQCFVVEVNGTIVRPDGKIYHLTWSIDRSKGAKPVDSNAAIETNGFDHILAELPIETTPGTFN